MPVPLDYQGPLEPEGSPEDRRLLQGVSIANYLWGCTCFVLFGFPFGLSFCMLPFHGLGDEPGVSGLRTILFVLGFSTPGVLMGALTICSAKWIARRRRWTFSVRWSITCICLGILASAGLLWHVTRVGRAAPGLVVAGLLITTGAIVGLATYRALTRPSVRLLYAGGSGRGASTERGGHEWRRVCFSTPPTSRGVLKHTLDDC